MKTIIDKMESLQIRYPNKIFKFRPPTDLKIIQVENSLKIKLDAELIEIYRYSDGFSFLDYCLLGIDNRKLGKLVNQDYLERDTKTTNKLVFMVTSVSKYYYLDRSNGLTTIRYWDMDSNIDIKVANGIYEFFEKFIDKVEVLLKNIEPNRIIVYFEDDDMPDYLADW